MGAIRARRWKLLEYFEDNRVELYDLNADLSERQDQAQELPERAAKLRGKLRAWRQAVDAALPRPNPDFKAKR